MNNELTSKQRDVLNAIINFVDHGKSPSYQELAEALGKSHVTMIQYVKLLRKKKWVDISPRDSRSIKVLKRPNQKSFRFIFKPEIIYKPNYSTPYLTLNLNSLFPPVIADSSVIRTNDTTQTLPPIVSNFLAGYEPIMSKGCIAECEEIHIPKYFNCVSVDHLFVNGYSTYYSHGNWKMGVYLAREGTNCNGNTVTVLNQGSNQLGMDLNHSVRKILSSNKHFFGSLNDDSTGFVTFDCGQVYQFTKHVTEKRGDLEVFVLWSLTHFPVLTADRKLKNNILRNGGKVYFYNKRKEQICLSE